MGGKQPRYSWTLAKIHMRDRAEIHTQVCVVRALCLYVQHVYDCILVCMCVCLSVCVDGASVCLHVWLHVHRYTCSVCECVHVGYMCVYIGGMCVCV